MALYYSIEELIDETNHVRSLLSAALGCAQQAKKVYNNQVAIGATFNTMYREASDTYERMQALLNEASSSLSDINYAYQPVATPNARHNLIITTDFSELDVDNTADTQYNTKLMLYTYYESSDEVYGTQQISHFVVACLPNSSQMAINMAEYLGFTDFQVDDRVEIMVNEYSCTGNNVSGLYEVHSLSYSYLTWAELNFWLKSASSHHAVGENETHYIDDYHIRLIERST